MSHFYNLITEILGNNKNPRTTQTQYLSVDNLAGNLSHKLLETTGAYIYFLWPPEISSHKFSQGGLKDLESRQRGGLHKSHVGPLGMVTLLKKNVL